MHILTYFAIKNNNVGFPTRLFFQKPTFLYWHLQLCLYDNWCITNPVNLNLHTDDILIQELIDEVNELYIRITEFKTSIDTETDRYFEEKGRGTDVWS